MDSDDYFSLFFLQAVIDKPILGSIFTIITTFLLLVISTMLSLGINAISQLSPEEINTVKDAKTNRYQLVKRLLDHSRNLQYSVYFIQTAIHVLLPSLGFYLINTLFPTFLSSAFQYVLIAAGYFLLIFLFANLLSGLIIKNNTLHITEKTAPLLIACEWLFRPFSKLKLFNLETKKENLANETSIISKESFDEKEMLEEIIHFYNKTADEIMIPRLDMRSISIEISFVEILDIIAKTGYSRFPVYEETEDNIKGILYVKDMIQGITTPESFRWKDLIRPVYFVPETKKLEDLLEEFRTNKVHIAIVVDEFGCTSGLVTMEDIIEEIVGEIADEYDTDEKLYFQLPDGSYIFEAKIQLNDFFRETDVDSSDFGKMVEEVDTLGGLLLKIKGSLPKRRELIHYKKYYFRILEADDRRVLKIKFNQTEDTPSKKKGQ